MSDAITFRAEDHTYWKGTVQLPGFHEVLSIMLPGENYYANPSYYAWRGREIHAITAEYDKGGAITNLEEETAGFFAAYEKFLHDHEVIWLSIEQILHNERLQYCGTLDRYGMVDNKPCILDIKTGVASDSITALQLCAYSMCITEALQYWYVLYLRKDGNYKLLNLYDPALRAVWIGVMNFYWWRKRVKK